MTKKITIVEVGPRDGLQNEPKNLDIKQKLTFINMLADAGLSVIEVGSFVSPKWVPQMAGTADVIQSLNIRQTRTRYQALVPNMMGYDNAIKTNIKEVSVFTAVSESFTQKNINCSVAQSIERLAPVIKQAKDDNKFVRGYVSCIAFCPYEGFIYPQKTADLSSILLDLGCDEISLGDTIGKATPNHISDILESCRHLPIEKLAVHCHDTYGTAMANIAKALELGIRIIDASASGLGGCPYAKGAGGNVDTNDVVFFLHQMGYETGVDAQKLALASQYIDQELGRQSPSRTLQRLNRLN